MEATIAAVLNFHTVVLNKGAADGMRRGMRFALHAAPLEITDPGSGEALGTLSTHWTEFQVGDVYPRFSTASIPDGKIELSKFDLKALADESHVISSMLKRYLPEKERYLPEKNVALEPPWSSPFAVGDTLREFALTLPEPVCECGGQVWQALYPTHLDEEKRYPDVLPRWQCVACDVMFEEQGEKISMETYQDRLVIKIVSAKVLPKCRRCRKAQWGLLEARYQRDIVCRECHYRFDWQDPYAPYAARVVEGIDCGTP